MTTSLCEERQKVASATKSSRQPKCYVVFSYGDVIPRLHKDSRERNRARELHSLLARRKKSSKRGDKLFPSLSNDKKKRPSLSLSDFVFLVFFFAFRLSLLMLFLSLLKYFLARCPRSRIARRKRELEKEKI